MKLAAQPHPGGARVKHIALAVLASTQGQSPVLPAAAKPTQSPAFANPATAHKGGRPHLEEAAAVNDKILQEHPPILKMQAANQHHAGIHYV